MSDFIRQLATVQGGFKLDEAWVILSPVEASIKSKIDALGIPLKDWDISIYRGILTGYNEAFMIDEKTRQELIKASPKNGEIIRPILRGKHIKKYSVNNSESIIFIPCGWTNLNKGLENPETFFKKTYPAIFEHLIEKSKLPSKGKGLFNRDDKGDYWWELRPCAYVKEFEKSKIIYIDIMTDNEEDGYLFPCFSFSTKKELILNTAYFIAGAQNDLLYILAILNSRIGRFIVRNYVTQLGQRQYRLFQQNVETFPIPQIAPLLQSEISELALKLAISDERREERAHIEGILHKKIMSLYNFTESELNVITNNN